MFRDIAAAIRTRMGATVNGCSVAWPNEKFSPTVQQPWIYAEVRGNGTSGTGVGSAGLRQVTTDGLIEAHVYVPAGKGTDAAYQTADAVGALFQLAAFPASTAAIATGAASVGDAEPGDDKGLWWRVSVVIPFTAHYTA